MMLSVWLLSLLLSFSSEAINPRPAHIALMVFISMLLGFLLRGLFFGVAVFSKPAFKVMQAVCADGVIGLFFWAGSGLWVVSGSQGGIACQENKLC